MPTNISMFAVATVKVFVTLALLSVVFPVTVNVPPIVSFNVIDELPVNIQNIILNYLFLYISYIFGYAISNSDASSEIVAEDSNNSLSVIALAELPTTDDDISPSI